MTVSDMSAEQFALYQRMYDDIRASRDALNMERDPNGLVLSYYDVMADRTWYAFVTNAQMALMLATGGKVTSAL